MNMQSKNVFILTQCEIQRLEHNFLLNMQLIVYMNDSWEILLGICKPVCCMEMDVHAAKDCMTSGFYN